MPGIFRARKFLEIFAIKNLLLALANSNFFVAKRSQICRSKIFRYFASGSFYIFNKYIGTNKQIIAPLSN
jgi:hypothetical protein